MVGSGKGDVMNKRKTKKFGRWFNYIVGLTGHGPTAIDIKPNVNLGKKEKMWFRNHRREIEQEKQRRQECYRKAYLETLGEDPDDFDF
jgi:hypothetical protein